MADVSLALTLNPIGITATVVKGTRLLTVGQTLGACSVVATAVQSAGSTPTILRVQSKTAVNQGPVDQISVTFDAPPTVGNAVVVAVIVGRSDGPIQTRRDWTVTDNQGHLYYLTMPIVPEGGYSGSDLISQAWYMLKVLASSAPFTVTVVTDPNYELPVNDYWLTVCLIEATGVGTGLGVNQWMARDSYQQGVGPGTKTLNPTVPLTVDQAFIVGIMNVIDPFSQASNTLVVESLTPPWYEEFESVIPGYIPSGEIDTRSIADAVGTQIEGKWTQNFTANFSCAVIAFQANAPVPTVIAGLDTIQVEVLRDPVPDLPLDISQYAIELLTLGPWGPVHNLAHVSVEVLYAPGPGEINLSDGQAVGLTWVEFTDSTG